MNLGKKCNGFLKTAIRSVDEENLKITHTINTKALDRYYTSVLPQGADVKHFLNNAVVLWSHNMDEATPKIPIGRCVDLDIREDEIVATTEFNKNDVLAVRVFNAYRDGFLHAWSIGFMPIQYEGVSSENREAINAKYNLSISEEQIQEAGEFGAYVISKWELLEYSAVPVPGNPEALSADKAKSFKRELVIRGLVEESDVEKVEIKEEEKKEAEEFECECLDCGKVVKSEQHCKEIKCPDCGGEMRRKERPGIGKDVDAEKKESRDAEVSSEEVKAEVKEETVSVEEEKVPVVEKEVSKEEVKEEVEAKVEEKVEEVKEEAEVVEEAKTEEVKEDIKEEEKEVKQEDNSEKSEETKTSEENKAEEPKTEVKEEPTEEVKTSSTTEDNSEKAELVEEPVKEKVEEKTEVKEEVKEEEKPVNFATIIQGLIQKNKELSDRLEKAEAQIKELAVVDSKVDSIQKSLDVDNIDKIREASQKRSKNSDSWFSNFLKQ